MKLSTLILLGVFFIFGCNRKPKNHNPPLAPTEITSDTVVPNVASKPNNSLDYLGLYKGKLACDGCPEMETSLELSEDFTYLLTKKYIGKKDKPIEQKGAYSWNKQETAIILENVKDGPNQYMVGEKMLTQLDANGNKLDGDSHILRKLSEAEGEKSDGPLPAKKQPSN